MKIRLWPKIGLIFVLILTLFLLTSLKASADEVKYIYDDLGRLYQVIDEQGNVATYNYDDVGNLLSITRSTGGIPTPKITSISPNGARGGDKINVTITGNALMGAQVTTDNPGIAVSNVRATATSITAVFTLSFIARQGHTTVTVTTSLGSDSTSFTVNPPPPIINALNPASGPVSRLVKIIGTGFNPTPSENQVKFNGITAPVYSSSVYSVLTSVPVGATSGPVTVATNGGTSNGFTFTVTSAAGPPPTITSITPNVGSVEGGSSITINGSGFTSDTQVYIGEEPVSSVAMVDASTLKIITPPGQAGSCDVLVTNKNGDAFLPRGFTYLPGPPQQVIAINPTMGLTNIPINTNITVLFARPLDKGTVSSSSYSLVETSSSIPVSGNFSFDFGDGAAFFKPDANLKPNTSYTLYITQDIKSSEGIPLNLPFSGSFITAGTTDTIPPKVTVTPANGVANVPVNTKIVFSFSESMNPLSINSSTITVANNGNAVVGGITVGQQNTVATFTPFSAFSPGSTVTVTLSAKVTDIAGNAIVGSSGRGTDLVISFTTATTSDIVAPRVLSINPPDKATAINTSTTVSVTFSEAINPVTVNTNTFTLSSGGTNYPGQISFSNQNAVATFIPEQALASNTIITVTLAAGITDVAGNATPTPFASTFTTQMGQDNYQPSVVWVSPYKGQMKVPLNSYTHIVFDERINPSSVNSSSFYLDWQDNYYVSHGVVGSISVSSDGLGATFIPSHPLLPNLLHKIHFTEGIKDLAGNPLYNPGSSSFTTGMEMTDTTPPQVVEVSPLNGAADVPINAVILIKFSEALDQTTINGSTIVVSQGGVPLEGNLSLEQDGRVVRYVVANFYTLKLNAFYEVRVTTGVTDTAGNPLSAEFVSGFTTGDATDTVAPDVVSVVPANGATNVSPETSIEVTFNEAIDPLTVHSSTFRVTMGSYWSSAAIPGQYTFSSDFMKVTFKPDYPFFAGQDYYRDPYYIHLANIEDLAGNKLSPISSYFQTGYAPGTNPKSLPYGATVVAKPNKVFADGNTTAIVEISNISNRDSVLVPNGTKIGVTTDPTPFYSDSAGGVILGGVASSADSRFKIFTTVGGKVSFTYQSANLPELAYRVTGNAYIQVVSVDQAEVPVKLIGVTPVTLFRGYGADIDVNPTGLLANGSSYSEVDIRVYGADGKPVPSGMKVGVTAEPVYWTDSLGGKIQGEEVAPDSRFKIFRTITGGMVNLTYVSPVLPANQNGSASIQVVGLDDTDRTSGLIGTRDIFLSGSEGYTAPLPRVLSVSPMNGQTGVALNVPVVAEFSQPLDPSTVTSNNFSIGTGGQYVPGTLSLSAGVNGADTIVSFTPTNPWAPNTVYYVYISTGIKSSSGNPLLQYYYGSFSTGVASDDQAPYVVKVNPPAGVTGVAINSVVSVGFSEPMNSSTINGSSFRLSDSGGDVTGRVVADSSTIFSFIPDSLLAPDTQYTITVGTTVTDMAGNYLASAFTSTFTTQMGQDNYQPSVIRVSPYAGQTGVALNSDISIVFDEPINPPSVNPSTFHLKYRGGYYFYFNVSGSISVSSDGLMATFRPSQPLLPNALYYISFTDGIKDIAGNPLYDPGAAAFTTGVEGKDTTPPEVVMVSPFNGATGIPINAAVLIEFSEAVDQTTVNGNTIVVSHSGVPLAGDLSLEQNGRAVRYVVTNLYTFMPNTFYEVRVTTGVTDTAGNPLLAEFVSGFTTADAADTVAPDVVSVVPADGATNVSPETSIEVTFNEAINPFTVHSATFWVTTDYRWNPGLPGQYTFSTDYKKVTFRPDYPLFAGNGYYIGLAKIEDLAGNKLPEAFYYFTTAYAPGTNPYTLPDRATVVANPNQLFANGNTTATVQITNINRNGTLVPNGTKIAVTADIGVILGGTVSTADSRFRIFAAVGGKVPLTYQSANLPELLTGFTKRANIKVYSVDQTERPVRLISVTQVVLFRGYLADIDVNPAFLLADGRSYSEVEIRIYDPNSQPVPPGTRMGVTADPVYMPESLGGTIEGGEVAPDSRFKLFRTITGGIVKLTYVSPVLAANQSGGAWVQVVEVDDTGRVVDLMGSRFGSIISLSGSEGYTAPQPRVLSVSPLNGQTDVGLDAPVVAEFSQPLDTATVTSENFSIRKGYSEYVSGTINLRDGVNGANTVVTFVPDNSWESNTSYSIYIGTGIKSSSGNPLLQYYYGSFSTGIARDDQAPYVVGVNPPAGVTGVAINSAVSVEFSEPMNPTTINRLSFRLSDSGGDVTGRVVADSSTTFSFIPDSMLIPSSNYIITVEATATDISGNAMASAFTSSFTTQSGQDNYQPSVVEVSPYNDQTGVALNSDVTIVFDERINPISVNSSSFYVTVGWWDAILGVITVSSDGLSATFSPLKPLLPNTNYTIYYIEEIKDVAGNPLYNPGSSSFTTSIELADMTPPKVIEVSPANGSTGVPINTAVLIKFSEALDRTTVNERTIVVSEGGVPLAGDLYLEQDGRVLRYLVANLYSFKPNTLYEVRVTTGVTDTAGNILLAEFVSGFTTGDGADTVAPDVVSVVPPNGARDVSPETSIEVTFNEAIDPVTINSATFSLFMDSS
jgi:YD repeat-containing protein